MTNNFKKKSVKPGRIYLDYTVTSFCMKKQLELVAGLTLYYCKIGSFTVNEI